MRNNLFVLIAVVATVFAMSGIATAGTLSIGLQVGSNAIATSIDNGQTMTVTAYGGTSSPTYTWGFQGTCPLFSTSLAGSTSSFIYNPTSGTSSNCQFVVSDSSGDVAATSNTVAVQVAPAIGISSTSQNLDIGQSATALTATVSAGSSNLGEAINWYNSITPSCSSSSTHIGAAATGSSASNTPSNTILGSTYYCAVVTDVAGGSATTSAANVVVSSALVAPSGTPTVSNGIVASTNTIEVGSPYTFNVGVASGGSTPITYTLQNSLVTSSTYYSVGGSSCSIITAGTVSCAFTPATAGTYNYIILATDSASTPIAKNSANSVAITVGTALTITSPSATAALFDTGVAINSPWFVEPVTLGTKSSGVMIAWYNSITPSCSSSGTQVQAPAAINTGNVFTPSNTVIGTTYYCAVATDSQGGTVTTSAGNVIIYNNPTVTLTSSLSTLDIGQPTTLTLTIANGIGTALTLSSWSSLLGTTMSGCPSSESSRGSFTCIVSPSTSGTDRYGVIVQDNGNQGYVTIANTPSVTVSPPLTAPAISLSANTLPILSSTSTDNGFSLSVYTNTPLTGGTPLPGGVYTCNWIYEAPGAGSYSAFGSTFSCGATGPTAYNTINTGALSSLSTTVSGTWHFELVVTDNAPQTLASSPVTITVNPPIAVTTSPNTIDLGGSNTLIANEIGGTGTEETFTWYNNGGLCSGSTLAGNTPTVTPLTTTTYCVIGTDSLGGTAGTNTEVVTVNPLPIMSLSPSSRTIDAGQSVTFTNTITLGTAPYTYTAYTISPSSGTSISSNMITFANAGTFNLYDSGSDSMSNTVHSANSVITVKAFPTVSIALTSSTATINSGKTVTFTATPSGGTGSWVYAWNIVAGGAGLSVSSGCGTSNSVCTVMGINTGSSPITPTVTVNVIDTGVTPNVNSVTTEAQTVTVNPGSVPATTTGVPATCTLSIAGGPIAFGNVASGTTYYTSSPITVQNGGTTQTGVTIYGSGWSYNSNSVAIPSSVGWTTYNAGSTYNSLAARALTATATATGTTLTPLVQTGNTMSLSFGLTLPSGILGGLTQTITLGSTC